MKDLSKGSISFKGIMFSSTTTRHGHLPDAPPVVTTTQFALEEHKVDFENNLDMSEEEILELNIPTGVPLVYEFDENFKPLKRYYLGNADEIAAKAAAVANQGKAK